jgi:membrane protease YdiL (CAAX protease family)
MARNGIAAYLVLVFGLAWGVVALGLFSGLLVLRGDQAGAGTYLILLLYATIPALAAWGARRVAPGGPELSVVRPGGWRRVLGVALYPFAVSVLIYTALTVIGITRPDWSFGALARNLEPVMATLGQGPLEPGGQFAVIVLIFAPLASIVLGATAYALVALGNEAGWRGYLEPRLAAAFGQAPAYIINALLWLVWLGPLYVAMHLQLAAEGEGAEEARAMLPRFLLLLLALSCILGEIRRRSGNVGLSAVFLGSFFAQSSYGGAGLWPFLFTEVREPWTGTLGWVSVVVWCLAAGVTFVFPTRLPVGQAAGPAAPLKVKPKRGADRSSEPVAGPAEGAMPQSGNHPAQPARVAAEPEVTEQPGSDIADAAENVKKTARVAEPVRKAGKKPGNPGGQPKGKKNKGSSPGQRASKSGAGKKKGKR